MAPKKYISMSSSSKKQGPTKKRKDAFETNLRIGGDMISKLPDDILVHILSFLTTKDAFKTSVLTHRWENLWTSVPNLEICPSDGPVDFCQKEKYLKYMDFVITVYMCHGSSVVNKFHIDCPPHFNLDALCDWIESLVDRNVQDIVINHFMTYLDLPSNLFTSKTLVSLKIAHFLAFDVPDSIHFPSLKVLHVSLDSPSDDLTKKLFCSSPVLEELHIDVDRDYKASIYNISSPRLKKLVLSIKTFRSENFDILVNIDAPALEYLEVEAAYASKFILMNSSALVKANVYADLHICHDEYLRHDFPLENLIDLLKSLSYVKDLSLSGRFPIAVFNSPSEINWPVFANVTHLELEINERDFDSSSFSRWPDFPCLKHLQLNVYNRYFASRHLPDLLDFVPKLVSLAFVRRGYSGDEGGEFNYSEQRVPSCLRSSLREIELYSLCGLKRELDLIGYLLVNAEVLEKMTVQVPDYIRSCEQKKVREFESEVEMMPKWSKNAKLLFI